MSMMVWTAYLDRRMTEEECRNIMVLLPPQRWERLQRIKDPKKREEALCAYWLLLAALKKRYGWERLPEIAWTSAGKPYFTEHADIYFNVSHTSGAAAVAIGDVPVGVDIEKARPVSHRMLERVGQETDLETFFQNWVRQEARAKCAGNGIPDFLYGERPLDPEEHWQPVDTFPGYAAAVAYRGAEEDIEVRNLLWSRDVGFGGYLPRND